MKNLDSPVNLRPTGLHFAIKLCLLVLLQATNTLAIQPSSCTDAFSNKAKSVPQLLQSVRDFFSTFDSSNGPAEQALKAFSGTERISDQQFRRLARRFPIGDDILNLSTSIKVVDTQMKNLLGCCDYLEQRFWETFLSPFSVDHPTKISADAFEFTVVKIQGIGGPVGVLKQVGEKTFLSLKTIKDPISGKFGFVKGGVYQILEPVQTLVTRVGTASPLGYRVVELSADQEIQVVPLRFFSPNSVYFPTELSRPKWNLSLEGPHAWFRKEFNEFIKALDLAGRHLEADIRNRRAKEFKDEVSKLVPMLSAPVSFDQELILKREWNRLAIQYAKGKTGYTNRAAALQAIYERFRLVSDKGFAGNHGWSFRVQVLTNPSMVLSEGDAELIYNLSPGAVVFYGEVGQAVVVNTDGRIILGKFDLDTNFEELTDATIIE